MSRLAWVKPLIFFTGIFKGHWFRSQKIFSMVCKSEDLHQVIAFIYLQLSILVLKPMVLGIPHVRSLSIMV